MALITSPEDTKHYDEARQCVEELALYLKPLSSARGMGGGLIASCPPVCHSIWLFIFLFIPMPWNAGKPDITRFQSSLKQCELLLESLLLSIMCPVRVYRADGCIRSLGVGLSNAAQSMLSRPMQRKLVTLVHCQLVEEEGRVRAMRAARSLGERTVTELILQHQNPQQLSSNLWAAVRARGCQFLGPGESELNSLAFICSDNPWFIF